MNGAISPILHNCFDMMVNTLHLMSKREKCEGKRAVAIFWQELCKIITFSLDSKSVSCVHKPHTLPLISIALCGDMWLTVWISVLEFVHRVYLFLTNLYFRRLLQTRIYRSSPTAMIHAS